MDKKELLDKLKKDIKQNLPQLHEAIEKLNVTDDEIIENLSIIYKKLEDNTKSNYSIDVFVTLEGKIDYSFVDKTNEKSLLINIEKMYKYHSFDDKDLFAIDIKEIKQSSHNKAILENIRLTKELLPKARGMWIYGDTGIGKTHIAIAMLNYFASMGYSVSFIVLSELIPKIKASFNTEDKFLSDFINVSQKSDILVIDDIGAEQLSEWARDEILFPILNYRMLNKKTTTFTSNVSIDEYENILRSKSKTKSDFLNIKRLIERIKNLSIEMNYVGDNKRKKS